MDHMLMNINHKLVVKLSGFSQFLPKKIHKCCEKRKEINRKTSGSYISETRYLVYLPRGVFSYT